MGVGPTKSEMEARSQRLSDEWKEGGWLRKQWNEKPQEEKDKATQKQRDAWAVKSQEEKDKTIQKIKDTWAGKSQEEKDKAIQKIKDTKADKSRAEKDKATQKRMDGRAASSAVSPRVTHPRPMARVHMSLCVRGT